MLASLITFICNMPLKRKILTHPIQLLPNLFYLSDAPHAVPHAVGFSAGLSAAPHAVPHAALVSAFFHPKRFDNAILLPPDILFVVIFVARL